MATSKRAPSKPRKKGTGGKSRAKRSGGWTNFASRARERLAWTVTREAVGGLLLVAGLFFSAAFFSGRGAFLGDAGLLAATHFVGRLGVWIAPLAAVGGLLILLRRLSGWRALGAVLLLVAVATTFAATLPRRDLFSGDSYTQAGGVVGSALYGAVHWTAGAVGAGLALAALYVLGLSLFTGVSVGSAVSAVRGAGSALAARWRERRERLAQEREPREGGARRRVVEEAPGVRDLYGELGEPDGGEPGPSGGSVGESLAETREFEIVVPESPEPAPFAAEREVAPGDGVPP